MQTRVPSVLGGQAALSPTQESGQILRIVDGRLTFRVLPVTPEPHLGFTANAGGRMVTNLNDEASADDFLVVGEDNRLTVNPDLL